MKIGFATLVALFILAPLQAGASAGDTAPTPRPVSENQAERTVDPSASSVDPVKEKSEPPVKRAVKKRRRPGRCSAFATPGYRKMVRNWQKVPQIPKPKWRDGYRDLTLYSVNLGERIRVFPFLADGSLDPEVLVEIARILRDKDTDAVHEVHPRLVKLLYKLASKLEARQINVVSGYREPKDEEGGGHHTDGSAVDFMIPGVKLAVVAKEARRLGHVGVGFYPTSGFIHLDVREGRSYFWSDRSGPGKPGCLVPVMKDAAWKFDARWRLEHDGPEVALNVAGEPKGPGDDASLDARKTRPGKTGSKKRGAAKTKRPGGPAGAEKRQR